MVNQGHEILKTHVSNEYNIYFAYPKEVGQHQAVSVVIKPTYLTKLTNQNFLEILRHESMIEEFKDQQNWIIAYPHPQVIPKIHSME